VLAACRASCLSINGNTDEIAGVIIFRNTPITLEFLAEWRDWLTNPEHELATVGEHMCLRHAMYILHRQSGRPEHQVGVSLATALTRTIKRLAPHVAVVACVPPESLRA